MKRVLAAALAAVCIFTTAQPAQAASWQLMLKDSTVQSAGNYEFCLFGKVPYFTGGKWQEYYPIRSTTSLVVTNGNVVYSISSRRLLRTDLETQKTRRIMKLPSGTVFAAVSNGCLYLNRRRTVYSLNLKQLEKSLRKSSGKTTLSTAAGKKSRSLRVVLHHQKITDSSGKYAITKRGKNTWNVCILFSGLASPLVTLKHCAGATYCGRKLIYVLKKKRRLVFYSALRDGSQAVKFASFSAGSKLISFSSRGAKVLNSKTGSTAEIVFSTETVSGTSVSSMPRTVLTADDVTTYTRPSRNSTLVSSLAAGTSVTLLYENSSWSRIRVGSTTQYVPTSSLYDPAGTIPELRNPPSMPERSGAVFNAHCNELGKRTGGTNGDQTGKEVLISSLTRKYTATNYKWETLIRCKDRHLAEAAAEEAVAAAGNNNIGYDNGVKRTTIWDEALSANYDLSAIENTCAGSCITTIMACYKCAAARLGITSVADMKLNIRSWDAASVLLSTGYFEVVSNANLRNASDNYTGDIYIAVTRDSSGTPLRGHALLQVTDGKNVD